mgnify:CR=1 FL=1
MARKRLWEYQKSVYKSGENVKIVFPAKLQFINQVPSGRNVYSIDTDIVQSSVVPNSSTTAPIKQT